MNSLMRPHLLSSSTFNGADDFDAVLFWQPNANTVLAVPPLTTRHGAHLNGVPC
jgi:hypothetical protein